MGVGSLKRNKKFFLMSVVMAVIMALAISCTSLKVEGPDDKINEQESIETVGNVETEVSPEPEVEERFEEITISAVGDILIHMRHVRSQYNAETKEYDFTNNFKYVKDYISSADIAIANLETTLSGSDRGYSGYPRFNSPDAVADALKYAGFDVITTANNHIIDYGAGGMKRTGQVLRSKGFDVIGTKENRDDKGYIIKEVKGIKVGLTNYAYETPRNGGRKTLNAIIVPSEVEDLIDTFNYDNLEEEFVKIQQRITEMKRDGAEVIVFCLHWGDEYMRKPNSYQKKIAQKLSDFGVDIIFGGHPHVLQPIDIVDSQISGKSTVVVYSLGNFISNQTYETMKRREPEDGMIANVHIRKNMNTGYIQIDEVSYIPTWVYRRPKGSNFIYEILPLDEALAYKDQFNLTTKDSIWRAENSRISTVTLIDTESARTASVPINEVRAIAVDADR
jgi:poly-gamma-glutamate capsule biosynthesis protein CapA/YwtB (metallophosphatase superfamily)